MFDIHTHSFGQTGSGNRIINLTPDEAERLFACNIEGSFSTGLHPCLPESMLEYNIEKLNTLATDRRIKVIGECGLDKNSKTALKIQTSVFEKHIKLSEEIRKPLVVHCIGRINELLEIKRILQPAQLWIIHGFRGKPQLADQILKAGCALSFGEFFNIESLKITPFDRLFTETDESLKPIEDICLNIAKAKNCEPVSLNAGKLLFENA